MSQIVPKLIQANLEVIEQELLVRLPAQTNALAVGASDAMQETAQVLFDGNPADGDQVEAIWRDYVNEHLITFAEMKATEAVTKFRSEIVKNLSQLLLTPAAESLRVLTDAETKDDQQLKALWVDFLKEGTNMDTLLANTLKPALLLVIKNEPVVDSLVLLIAAQLKTLIK